METHKEQHKQQQQQQQYPSKKEKGGTPGDQLALLFEFTGKKGDVAGSFWRLLATTVPKNYKDNDDDDDDDRRGCFNPAISLDALRTELENSCATPLYKKAVLPEDDLPMIQLFIEMMAQKKAGVVAATTGESAVATPKEYNSDSSRSTNITKFVDSMAVLDEETLLQKYAVRKNAENNGILQQTLFKEVGGGGGGGGGANPNRSYPNKDGQTMLYVAAVQDLDDVDAVEILKKKYGANASSWIDGSTTNTIGMMILHEFLLQHLQFSWYQGTVNRIFKTFLGHGLVDPNQENDLGRTLLGQVVQQQECGASMINLVETLLRFGASPNKKGGNEEEVPMICAMRKVSLLKKRKRIRKLNQIIRLLIERGGITSLDTIMRDSNGYTPLCLAVKSKNHELVSLLLRYGADPNKTCSNGKSPLFISVEQDGKDTSTGFWSCVNLLLKSGADPNKKRGSNNNNNNNSNSNNINNNEGEEYPLEVAVRRGRVSTAEALLDAGAMPSVCAGLPNDRILVKLMALENSSEVQALERDSDGNIVRVRLNWMGSHRFRHEIFQWEHLRTLEAPHSCWLRLTGRELLDRLGNRLKELHLSNVPPLGMEHLKSLESLRIGDSSRYMRRSLVDFGGGGGGGLPPNLKSLRVESRNLRRGIPSLLPEQLESLHIVDCSVQDLSPDLKLPPGLRELRLDSNPVLDLIEFEPILFSLLVEHGTFGVAFPETGIAPGDKIPVLLSSRVRYQSVLNRTKGRHFLQHRFTIPSSCWPKLFASVGRYCNFRNDDDDNNDNDANRETESSVLFTILRESLS